jgi:hypothetical protein
MSEVLALLTTRPNLFHMPSQQPTLSQSDIEGALAREWRQLREAGRLHTVLPACRTKQWVLKERLAGYVTLDYRLRRDVTISTDRGHEPASFVEQYWSVRTLDGIQDPHWLPALNLNVVYVRARPVRARDVDGLIRNALALRDAAGAVGRAWFYGAEKRAELYVHAAILAPVIEDDVRVLASMETLQEIPFRAAQLAFSMAEGFTFTGMPEEDEFWHSSDPQTAAALMEGLDGDALPAHGFQWPGMNTGPVWDATTRLTTHDGKVL